MCRAAESTSHQLRSMKSEEASEDISVVHRKKKERKGGQQNTKKCKYCGQGHAFVKEQCPAWGKTCTLCKKKNHFAKQCKSKKSLHTVDTDSEEDLFAVGCGKKGKVIKAKMIIQGTRVTCQVDSGASVNVISVKYAKNVKLEDSKTRLHMYNGAILIPKGKTVLTLQNPRNKKRFSAEFLVVKEDFTTLLGKKTSEEMGLITVHYDNFESVCRVSDDSDSVLNDFSDVFGEDQGSLPGIAHFKVDETVTPVISPSCRVPHSMKAEVKAELEKLTEKDIITPVSEPTSWCSRMVVAKKKSGDLRICIDPRPLNKALKREHYPLPVMEDLLPRLANAKVFSKLDLRNAYWHVHLDEESSKLTTFQTPYGRYRWKRCPFGTSTSSELFQKRLDQALEGLTGVIGVSDDIIVYGEGNDDKEATLDHDRNLRALLQRCRDHGMRLNRAKAELRKTEISFLGHLVTREGLKIDPEKVEAVHKMPAPENIEDVRRFCGFVNYLAKFLPKLSDVLEPLRQLTRADVEWTWTPTHDKALYAVKRLITEAPVLAFYDPQEELTIQCDASQSGLGAVLLQNDRPVAFASRALTQTESRYAQIEKELLAIVFALEKFHQYSFGRTVKVQSDHKPLESILQKPLSSAPRRLQGMMLRIQGYDIRVTYKMGKEMLLADTLSRAYIDSPSKQEDFEHVNMIDCLPIKKDRLERLKRATEDDRSLQKLKSVILKGWPAEKSSLPAELNPYFNFRDELTVQDELIFKGERVVVPHTLRSEMKQALHSAHTGIDACLRRARECLYWPGMTGDIKNFISTCETCQTYQTANQRETLLTHELPSLPWEKIGIDLFELEGKDYMVTVDYLTNYWELDRLESTNTTTIIKKLKAHFARYGLPSIVITDNGPQFTSSQFENFTAKHDLNHLTSSPHHAQSNGKAESAVKTAKALLRKNKDQYMAVLEYRNTPTQSTGTSPAQRFFNRRTRTLLPATKNMLKPAITHDSDRKKIIKNQDKQRKHFNKRAKDLSPLQKGDTVRIQPFTLGRKKWKRGTITQRQGRSYDVQADDGTIYRRNRVHLKKTAHPVLPDAPQPPATRSYTPVSAPEPDVQTSQLMSPADQPRTPARAQRSTPAPGDPVIPVPGGSPVPLTPPSPAVQTAAQKSSPADQTRTPRSSAPSPVKLPASPSRIPIRRSGRVLKLKRSKDFIY